MNNVKHSRFAVSRRTFPGQVAGPERSSERGSSALMDSSLRMMAAAIVPSARCRTRFRSESPPLAPFAIFIHHLPPAPGRPLADITEPSQIIDFRGAVGLTRIRGGGTGLNTDTGQMQDLFFRPTWASARGPSSPANNFRASRFPRMVYPACTGSLTARGPNTSRDGDALGMTFASPYSVGTPEAVLFTIFTEESESASG
jgi:hypothetical protein